MKRMFWLLFFIFALSLFILPPGVFAQECDQSNIASMNLSALTDLGNKCQEALNNLQNALKPNVDQLNKMNAAIAAFEARIKTIEADVAKKTQEIAEGEKELEASLVLASERIRQFYMRSYTLNPMYLLLSSTNIGSALRTMGYQQAAVNEDKKIIVQTALTVKNLEDKKKALEDEKSTLATLKEDTDRRAASVRKLVAEATAYENKLQGVIAAVTAAQQRFLAQKLTGLNLPTSLGAGPLYCTDDRKLDPGFSPAFAFFTFGIPHRVGMNQYGALGRARDGNQGYQDILRAYFNNISFEKRDPNMRIKVQGHPEVGLDQYLLGVYEMPGDWPIEALKAQAVAARSYALAYTDNGVKEICTTQSCQVYKGGNKGGNWEQAVKLTEGEIMTNGGSPITAWYSSTDGGYTFQSSDVGWSSRPWTKRLRDTNGDIGSFSDLQLKAYDRDSPCFYAAQGFRNEYGKSAWLKSEEVADIVNVVLLARRDSSVREHLYQPDKPNPAGTDTWDRDRVKRELENRGESAYSSVSSVSVTSVDWGNGITNQVTVSGDAGTQSFNGSEFKDFFNLRAPANIQIVGPLYNVEKR